MYVTELVRLLRPRQGSARPQGASTTTEIRVDDDPGFRARLLELTGSWTVPQIVIDDRPIGGYTELRRLDLDGELDDLLAA